MDDSFKEFVFFITMSYTKYYTSKSRQKNCKKPEMVEKFKIIAFSRYNKMVTHPNSEIMIVCVGLAQVQIKQDLSCTK